MGSGIRTDRGRSYGEIERVARKVRSVIAPDLAPTDPLPGVDLLERLERYYVTVAGEKIPLSYGVEQLPPGVEALTRYQPDEKNILVTLAESTYSALERDDPRARFTTVHDIGHGVLHGAELVRLSQIPHGQLGLYRKQDFPIYFDSEYQANAFGAALMMPADGLVALEADLGPTWHLYVASQFRASAEASRIRVENFMKHRRGLVLA